VGYSAASTFFCAELNAEKHGKRVKCGGVVITRQMPRDAGLQC
jgi:hypothetical protein